jgi:hypothetical protein
MGRIQRHAPQRLERTLFFAIGVGFFFVQCAFATGRCANRT